MVSGDVKTKGLPPPFWERGAPCKNFLNPNFSKSARQKFSILCIPPDVWTMYATVEKIWGSFDLFLRYRGRNLEIFWGVIFDKLPTNKFSNKFVHRRAFMRSFEFGNNISNLATSFLDKGVKLETLSSDFCDFFTKVEIWVQIFATFAFQKPYFQF